MIKKMNAKEKGNRLSLMQTILGILGIVGGIWMILAPFVLNYGGATVLDTKTKKPVAIDLSIVTTSDIICGVLLISLVGFALLAVNNATLARIRFYASIAVIIVGIYLITAPYIFDLLKVAEYMALDKPNTNDQLLGILTIVLGGFAFQTTFLPNEFGTGNISDKVSPVLN